MTIQELSKSMESLQYDQKAIAEFFKDLDFKFSGLDGNLMAYRTEILCTFKGLECGFLIEVDIKHLNEYYVLRPVEQFNDILAYISKVPVVNITVFNRETLIKVWTPEKHYRKECEELN